MTNVTGKSKARVIVSAKVKRADGTVENLGVIADSQPSLWTKFKKLFGG